MLALSVVVPHALEAGAVSQQSVLQKSLVAWGEDMCDGDGVCVIMGDGDGAYVIMGDGSGACVMMGV